MTGWLSWHVFQHDQHDELLASCMAPMIAGWRRDGLISDAFVLRYWERGPHVRLRLRPTSPKAAGRLRVEAPGELSAWCHTHPSAHPMSAEAYARLLARLNPGRDSAIGHDAGTVTELVRDGVVLEVPYRPETDRYGTGAALRASERHFSESTDISLAVLLSGASPAAREALAVIVLLDSVRSMPPEHRRSWIDQFVLARAARTEPRIALSGVAAALERPAPPVVQLRASLATLAEMLQASQQEYRPPAKAFGGICLTSRGDHAPTATIDISVHLFCNRIGITLPTEIRLRRSLAVALADDERGAA